MKSRVSQRGEHSGFLLSFPRPFPVLFPLDFAKEGVTPAPIFRRDSERCRWCGERQADQGAGWGRRRCVFLFFLFPLLPHCLPSIPLRPLTPSSISSSPLLVSASLVKPLARCSEKNENSASFFSLLHLLLVSLPRSLFGFHSPSSHLPRRRKPSRFPLFSFLDFAAQPPLLLVRLNGSLPFFPSIHPLTFLHPFFPQRPAGLVPSASPSSTSTPLNSIAPHLENRFPRVARQPSPPTSRRSLTDRGRTRWS